jgi:hypothetical protein
VIKKSLFDWPCKLGSIDCDLRQRENTTGVVSGVAFFLQLAANLLHGTTAFCWILLKSREKTGWPAAMVDSIR